MGSNPIRATDFARELAGVHRGAAPQESWVSLWVSISLGNSRVGISLRLRRARARVLSGWSIRWNKQKCEPHPRDEGLLLPRQLPIPTTGLRLTAIGHRPPRGARAPAEQEPQIAPLDIGERGRGTRE